MPYTPGDHVIVRSLDRRGRIVEARGGRYRVALGPLTVTVAEEDLRAPEAGKKKRKARPLDRRGTEDREAEGGAGAVHRVDLHGLTTEAAREAVIGAVNRAVLEGASTLEVVHGIGTGRVREAAWQELERLSVVRHVRPHPGNRGVTIAHL